MPVSNRNVRFSNDGVLIQYYQICDAFLLLSLSLEVKEKQRSVSKNVNINWIQIEVCIVCVYKNNHKHYIVRLITDIQTDLEFLCVFNLENARMRNENLFKQIFPLEIT